jgi:hypothetical protein
MEEDESPAEALRPGMIYEDCSFHPCLCTNVETDGEVNGISLIDGSAPRGCDLHHCGVEILTVSDVLEVRRDFDAYVARRMSELGRGR